LLTRVRNAAVSREDEHAAPSDAAILGALTRAYGRERYGGKQSESALKSYLGTWVPHLVKRLTDNTK